MKCIQSGNSIRSHPNLQFNPLPSLLSSNFRRKNSQILPQYLPRRRFRNNIDQNHPTSQPLMRSNSFSDELCDLLREEWVARVGCFGDDCGDGALGLEGGRGGEDEPYARGSSVARASSQTPMTAQSATMGEVRSNASSSAGGTYAMTHQQPPTPRPLYQSFPSRNIEEGARKRPTWKPEYLIKSLVRSTIVYDPSSDRTQTSPVISQPSLVMVSLVAFSF